MRAGAHRRDNRGSCLDQSTVSLLEAGAGPRRAAARDVAIPSHVHWDLFIGSAPERPYNPVYHPHNWRGWWDFGTGALGDMACHTTNMPYMALQLGVPVRSLCQELGNQPGNLSGLVDDHVRVSGRGNLPPVKLTWYEGAKDGKRNLPPASVLPDRSLEPRTAAQ